METFNVTGIVAGIVGLLALVFLFRFFFGGGGD